jgi:hypothetical protein
MKGLDKIIICPGCGRTYKKEKIEECKCSYYDFENGIASIKKLLNSKSFLAYGVDVPEFLRSLFKELEIDY